MWLVFILLCCILWAYVVPSLASPGHPNAAEAKASKIISVLCSPASAPLEPWRSYLRHLTLPFLCGCWCALLGCVDLGQQFLPRVAKRKLEEFSFLRFSPSLLRFWICHWNQEPSISPPNNTIPWCIHQKWKNASL